MAQALVSASDALNNSSVLIINGDDYQDIGLMRSVVDMAGKTGAFGVIPARKVTHYQDLGYLKFDGARISSIIEKPGYGNEPSEFVAMLGHYIEDAGILLDEISKTDVSTDDRYERALSALMKVRMFSSVPYSGHFCPLKYPWHVLDVMDDLFDQTLKEYRGKNITIKNNVVIEGNVYIGNNVKIFENSKITGPVYIGDNVIIGNNNIIRSSHIGAGSVTGFGTDITRSYIGDNCWFHSNYIGDSVLESDISMGSGAVLANLRLDAAEIQSIVSDRKTGTGRDKFGSCIGKNVKIGVNVSIMPGIKIGMGSFVASGVVVDTDIPAGSYAYARQDVVCIPNRHQSSQRDKERFRSVL